MVHTEAAQRDVRGARDIQGNKLLRQEGTLRPGLERDWWKEVKRLRLHVNKILRSTRNVRTVQPASDSETGQLYSFG